MDFFEACRVNEAKRPWLVGKRSKTMQRDLCVAVMDQLAVLIKRPTFLGVMVILFVNGNRHCCVLMSHFVALCEGCSVRGQSISTQKWSFFLRARTIVSVTASLEFTAVRIACCLLLWLLVRWYWQGLEERWQAVRVWCDSKTGVATDGTKLPTATLTRIEEGWSVVSCGKGTKTQNLKRNEV